MTPLKEGNTIYEALWFYAPGYWIYCKFCCRKLQKQKSIRLWTRRMIIFEMIFKCGFLEVAQTIMIVCDSSLSCSEHCKRKKNCGIRFSKHKIKKLFTAKVKIFWVGQKKFGAIFLMLVLMLLNPQKSSAIFILVLTFRSQN